MKHNIRPTRVLAIDPTSRGFGFAVLEGSTMLVDWGVREMRGCAPGVALVKFDDLLQHYQPDIVVVEDYDARGSRRGQRARRIIDSACDLARSRRMKVKRVSVTKLFGNGARPNKHRIATAIVENFPCLADRLPPQRKAWTSEPERMGIFDAVAFGLAYYGDSFAQLL